MSRRELIKNAENRFADILCRAMQFEPNLFRLGSQVGANFTETRDQPQGFNGFCLAESVGNLCPSFLLRIRFLYSGTGSDSRDCLPSFRSAHLQQQRLVEPIWSAR